MEASLLRRYNQPVPRYTSYPTVPFWKGHFDVAAWKQHFSDRFSQCNAGDGMSLYIHLPFCESLCLYCGCTKKITSNHAVEEEYIDAVLAEWGIYRRMMDQPPLIRELHLGGGTPTFFSPANLHKLVWGILSTAVVHPDHAFSVEGHPNNTTREHLEVLAKLGFRRISYGVQDLTAEVQQAIGRIQPFANVSRATEDARLAGFTAINFDLIYGLPAQTPDRLRRTIEQSISLRPDRIAFYSYAHTPGISCNQRLLDTSLLPTADEKICLHELGKDLFTGQGYVHIGMDHFALPGDELTQAWANGRLHRNFMGYTTQNSGLLLGLGMSSISDTGKAFAQNDKRLSSYYRAISAGALATVKGYFLTDEDLAFRRYILDIACKGSAVFDRAWAAQLQEWTVPRLKILEADGLVTLGESGVALTEAGRPFLRFVCKAFDLHLLRDEWARAGLPLCGYASGV
jgi:oxygen-independent coproporphyrinogen-3 oxidase